MINDKELKIILVRLNASMVENNRINREFMKSGEKTAAQFSAGMAAAFGQVITVLSGYMDKDTAKKPNNGTTEKPKFGTPTTEEKRDIGHNDPDRGDNYGC